MALFLWPEVLASDLKSPNQSHKSPDSPNSSHAMYYVLMARYLPKKNVVNCMTRASRIRRLMNAVWRLVRTFWPKKKCHHIRTFSKVLKLMAFFKVLMLWHVFYLSHVLEAACVGG